MDQQSKSLRTFQELIDDVDAYVLQSSESLSAVQLSFPGYDDLVKSPISIEMALADYLSTLNSLSRMGRDVTIKTLAMKVLSRKLRQRSTSSILTLETKRADEAISGLYGLSGAIKNMQETVSLTIDALRSIMATRRRDF